VEWFSHFAFSNAESDELRGSSMKMEQEDYLQHDGFPSHETSPIRDTHARKTDANKLFQRFYDVQSVSTSEMTNSTS
jgi:hypothetical protein